MIDHRQLFKEIPAGRFHSVLMTSFSLNLYYWEVQLLRALSGKGINYVSAIVDADCLSEQLLKFSKAFTGSRALDFSLHGYKMKGAFHPKIQFYVGRDSVLVLVGSGNLTISGHGKNLEVWTPVMVENEGSAAYPFVREVWHYLKGLYAELGEEAVNIVSSLENNCSLLQGDYHPNESEFDLGVCSIRFFANQKSSIFDQCKDWIDDERIKSITVMSPFYDRRAELIKALYEQFRPQEMNVIVEKGFGSVPKAACIPDYVKLYRWDKVGKTEGKTCQEFFHSKCFFFEGETNHFMLCGSANASVAAFGLPGVIPSNHEASVGLRSASIDYFEQTGFRLDNPINSSDINDLDAADANDSDAADSDLNAESATCWIKEASYFFKSYSLSVENSVGDNAVVISFYSGARKLLHTRKTLLRAGVSEIDGKFDEACNPLYVELTDSQGRLLSNRQFVIPVESMEANNPSPESNYIRKRSRDIESGKFVNGEVLRFIEQILDDTDRQLSVKADRAVAKVDKTAEGTGNKFDTIDDYLKDDGNGITGGRSERVAENVNTNTSMLFDSIVAYIGKSNKEKADEDFDDDEETDFGTSEGKDKTSDRKLPLRSDTNAATTRSRVMKMLDKYLDYLEETALAEKPRLNRIYLSKAVERFTTAVYFLHRTFSYRFTLEEGAEEVHTLLDLQYSVSFHKTVTQYFYRLVSLFALYLKNAKVENETEYVTKKLEAKKQYSFNLCLVMMSICDWQNDGNADYERWAALYRLPTMMNIAKALGVEIKPNSVSAAFKCFDRDLQELDGFDKSNVLTSIGAIAQSMLSPTSLYPNGNLFLTERFWYVALKPVSPAAAVPCSMAFGYNKVRKEYCPDYLYLYSRNQIYPVKPKK